MIPKKKLGSLMRHGNVNHSSLARQGTVNYSSLTRQGTMNYSTFGLLVQSEQQDGLGTTIHGSLTRQGVTIHGSLMRQGTMFSRFPGASGNIVFLRIIGTFH